VSGIELSSSNGISVVVSYNQSLSLGWFKFLKFRDLE